MIPRAVLLSTGGYAELPPEALTAFDLGDEIGLLRFLGKVPPGFYVCPAPEEPEEADARTCGLCHGVGLLCVAVHPDGGHMLHFEKAREQLNEKADDQGVRRTMRFRQARRT